jgi:nitrous oxide reductase accessory protein NosL
MNTKLFALGRWLAVCLGLVTSTTYAQTPATAAPIPNAKEACPVCGMLVAKYPNWIATVVYANGDAHHFDGPKDFFKYVLNTSRYAPKHRKEDISSLWVTDFYNLKRIDARQAWYVVGSDVVGPMGEELIPLATEEDAKEFLQDHHGSKTFRFNEISRAIIEKVDLGRF